MADLSSPFLWGVSISGYQHEGGYNGPQQPHNNWAVWEQQGRVATTGSAADFWHRYEADFKRCRQMGLNAFRLSIEWARVQPSTQPGPTSPPPIDAQALQDYCDRIASCRHHGLEPLVTLQHFTHPAWLGIDAWLQPQTVDAYLDYVEAVITRINQQLQQRYQQPPIHWYITINEPNILVANTYLKAEFPSHRWGLRPALRAYNHLLSAHIRAYNLIHDRYEAAGWPTPQVSFNTYCSDLYWSEKVLWDLMAMRSRQIPASQVEPYIHQQAKAWETSLDQAHLPFKRDLAYQIGRGVRWVANAIGHRLFNAEQVAGVLDTLQASPRDQVIDFLAIDYYDPFFAHSLRWPTFSDVESSINELRSWLMSGITSKWWDWRCLPEGLSFFVRAYTRDVGLPLLIAENGMALRRTSDNKIAPPRTDQLQRSEFLQAHLQQVQQLRQDQVPLLGYFHWSLTDNYEWGSYTPRFGLFAIDFSQSPQRQTSDHLKDRPSETYARLIQPTTTAEPPASASTTEGSHPTL